MGLICLFEEKDTAGELKPKRKRFGALEWVMASPTNKEVSDFIEYIVKTATRDEKGLKEDD